MTTNPAELLRSDNPKERAQGIKLVAKRQDDRALRVLLQMAEADDDPRVREYAQKGARYVARKMEEHGEDPNSVLAADAPPEPEPEPFRGVVVSDGEEKRAQSYVNEALDHNFGGDREKALKALAKALKTNPNLQLDEYFLSLISDVTGMEGPEGLAVVQNQDRRQGMIDADQQRKVQMSTADHMATAEGFTWTSTAIDVAIVCAITFLGMFFTILAIGYSANSFVDSAEERLQAQVAEIEETGAELDEEAEQQVARSEAQISAVRELLGVFNLPLGAIMGFTSTVYFLTTLFVLGFAGHYIAQSMGGNGTIPYLMHNLIGAYQIPLLVLFGVMIIAVALMLLGGFIYVWFAVLVSFIMIITTLAMGVRASQRFGRAYQLGGLKGQIAYFIAGIPASMAAILVVVLLYALLTPFFAGMIESVGQSLAGVDLPG